MILRWDRRPNLAHWWLFVCFWMSLSLILSSINYKSRHFRWKISISNQVVRDSQSASSQINFRLKLLTRTRPRDDLIHLYYIDDVFSANHDVCCVVRALDQSGADSICRPVSVRRFIHSSMNLTVLTITMTNNDVINDRVEKTLFCRVFLTHSSNTRKILFLYLLSSTTVHLDTVLMIYTHKHSWLFS